MEVLVEKGGKEDEYSVVQVWYWPKAHLVVRPHSWLLSAAIVQIINRCFGFIELLRSPQPPYKSSEDPSNVDVDPMGHLTPPP